MTTRRLISTDPEVLGGVPVFSGTRVPVQTLLDYLTGGDALDTFLTDFPSVTREQAVAFIDYAGSLVLEAGHASADR